MIRLFDLLFALFGLVLLSPLFIVIAVWIKLDSKGSVFYTQERIGLNGKPFQLYKFRTMFIKADKASLLTIGQRDPRITRSGIYLRKNKLDELPQLINVLLDEMSLVGPRPEVKRFVDMYTEEQRKILQIKPGITDHASIQYKNENAILSLAEDPEYEYISKIMPHKIALNMRYLENVSLKEYFKIIFKTIISLIK